MKTLIILLALCGSCFGISHSITSEDLRYDFTSENGLTAGFVGTRQYLFTSSTAVTGPLGTRTKVEDLAADTERFTVRHTYSNGYVLCFDHVVSGRDITCKLTILNDSADKLTLTQWMSRVRVLWLNYPVNGKQTVNYPGSYSPVMWDADSTFGFGVNWINHQCRPVKIQGGPSSSSTPTKDRQFMLYPLSSIEAGGRATFTVTFRTASTDWKDLLAPYKTWFNATYGTTAAYAGDFRAKGMYVPSNAELITDSLPYGDRLNLAANGWQETLTSMQSIPVGLSHIVFWPPTADKRGGNYRPEFDTMPAPVADSMTLLRQFCEDRQMSYGWFSRPNGIAYRKTWDTDSIIPFLPTDPAYIAMIDARYDAMVAMGCTAFYLDTYGASGDASYLKHLRTRSWPGQDEGFGRRLLLFSEGGFDVQHVYAPIWPNAQDSQGKRPFGEYQRWLMPGTYEVCRCFTLAGAERAWAEGGVPIVATSLVNAALMSAQAQYVNPDGSSKVRGDVPLN